jgi:Domain of Unknown Function (DUF928)
MKSIKLFLTIAIASVISLVSLNWVVAQSPPTGNSTPVRRKNSIFILPTPPAGLAPGGRRYGGARRGSCPNVEPKLTALVPSSEQPASVTNVWALTTMERPTLWVYLPYTTSSQYPADFVVQDEDANLIAKTAIALSEKPGIIPIPLPANTPPLAEGKQYRWFFNIYCGKDSPPIYVEGVVRRVALSPTVSQELATAQPKQRFAIYAKNGIWHEALTTIAELRQKNPQDRTLATQWSELLQAIGLDELAAKPILPSK